MKPRILPLDDLMVKLEGEHDEVCYDIRKVEAELQNSDLEKAGEDLRNIVGIISQHTIDEQRSLLGFLIQKLGRDKSNSYIEVVRGHVEILNSLKRIIASVNGGESLTLADLEGLRAILLRQFDKEQQLFREAADLMDSNSKAEIDEEIDRYVNEGGR